MRKLLLLLLLSLFTVMAPKLRTTSSPLPPPDVMVGVKTAPPKPVASTLPPPG